MIFSEQISAIFFGFLQGLTEFLPVSSSGHLALLHFFLNIQSFDLLFVLILHLGTLFAILSYYKKDIFIVLKCFISKPFHFSGPGRFVYLAAWATLPGVLGAFLLNPLIKKSLLNPEWTAWGFIFTGTLLFCTRRTLKAKAENKLLTTSSNDPPTEVFSSKAENPASGLSFTTAFLIGLAQVLAFFPGMSRSGWTIAVALFLGWPRKQALFFSFLLAIPAIIGGTLLELIKEPLPSEFSFSSLSLAFLSSWLVGYMALKWLIRSLQNLSFSRFAFYLWPLGLFMLILLNSG